MVNLHCQKHGVRPILLYFSDWLKEKAEGHNLMKNTATETKNKETITPVTKTKITSKVFAAITPRKSYQKPQQSSPSTSIVSCLWECCVFKRKTPTQRAKVEAEAKLCFFFLRDEHKFRQCTGPRKCKRDGSNSSRETILQGAEKIFPSETLK